jgi:hypothetical protein
MDLKSVCLPIFRQSINQSLVNNNMNTPTKKYCMRLITHLRISVFLLFMVSTVGAQNLFDNVGIYSAAPTCGYSLRKIRFAYTGSAILARRSGDNATQNIGFSYAWPSGLDTVSLNAFTAAGNVWDAGVLISGSNLYYNKQLSNGSILVTSYGTSKVHSSTDNGATWNAGVLVAAGSGVTGITQLANGHVLAAGYDDNKVYRSTDNGATWNSGTLITSGGNLHGITQIVNGHVLVIGSNSGKVFRSTDNGTTWDAGVLIASGAQLNGITQLSNGDILVVGYGSSKIYRSTDNGLTWDAGLAISGASLTGVTQLTNGNVLAMGFASNKVYRSTNNGYTWDAGTLVAAGAGMVGVSQLANGDVIASATNGKIYKSTKVSAFVNTWYDQSSNALHAIQTLTANQPRIVNAGVIDRVNGVPAILFTGSSYLTHNSFPTSGFSGFSANIVAKWTTVGSTLGSVQTLVDNNHTSAQGFEIQDRPDLSGKPVEFGITAGSSITVVRDNAQTGNGTSRILTFAANSSTLAGYREGFAMTTSTISGTSYSLQSRFTIGAWYNNGVIARYTTGNISELIIVPFSLNASNERLGLECDQRYYYGVSNPTIGIASSSPTVCNNVAMVSITHTTSGITGLHASAPYLPPGVTATWASNVLTISGTPTTAGVYYYYVPLTDGKPCSPYYAEGIITVNLNSASAASSSPTLCTNTPLTLITRTTSGATGIGSPTGLPAGVTATWSSNTITISGTPTLAGTYNYSIPLTGGCGTVSATGTIVVTNSGTGNTVGAASSTPTLCNGTLLTTITRNTSGATGIGLATGLPAGVTAAWAANVITISGTPTVSGTFNYSIPLTGGCGAVNATGTIVVNNSGAANTAGAASSSPTLCAGQALTNITHATTNANGIGTASGLPAGLTAAWAGNVITISGTPAGNGAFTYSIPLSGGCGTVSATGTITVISTQPFITSSLPITAVGTVSALAGNSNGNLDGTGTAARFRYPIAVVADAVGNVYVTDGNNHNIRKITPSGVVTTVAGTTLTSGQSGYVDATGAAARFNYPYGIAIDKFGTLFVADINNNVIRKITPLGVVSTYAGSGAFGNTNGNALSATFNYLTGVATDAAGNVYVADGGNYVIRKITPSGIVSNFAGTGTAGISDGPAAVASFDCMDQMCSDASGNLYLYDGCNYIVRKVTPSGEVSTIAGSGYFGYNDGVGTAASFDWMQGIAADAAGNVYVSDAGNLRIRRITPAGVVSTLAGSGTYTLVEGVGANASFRYSAGLAFDPSGNLFVVEQNSRRIRKIVIAETVGLCVGDPVVLTSNGGVSYTWAGPQAITNNASFNATVSGVFTTTVTNTAACTATRSIFVGQPSQSWAGSSSKSWSTASNWAGGYLPDRYTKVTIPSGTANSVSITANASAYDLTINSGATFTNGANGQLTLYRNFTNNGSFVSSNSSVSFLGCNATNTITSASGISFNNLTVNNPAGLVLAGSANVSVTNSLTLSNGAVTTGTNYLIMTNTAAANLNYVNGYINGNLRRNIASNNSTYSFAVASGTAATDRHQSALINNFLTGVTYIDASVTEFTKSGANVDANLNTTQNGSSLTASAGKTSGQTTIWQFNPNANPTGGSYGVILSTENTNLSGSDDNTFCPLKRSNSSSYANFLSFDATTTIPTVGAAGRIYNSGNGYAQRTGYTSFSEYIIGKTSGGVLPIELLSFDAVPENNRVNLKWVTASEKNCAYFTIEKSTDAVNFETVGTARGAGNSNKTLSYTMVDEKPYQGLSYYRLKQVDFDGAFNYSKIVAVDFLNEEYDIKIYPNPTSDRITIDFLEQVLPPATRVSLSNVYGQQLELNQIISKNQINMDLSPLPSGIYFVGITFGEKIIERKIVLQK